jgi:hypothetical protein
MLGAPLELSASVTDITAEVTLALAGIPDRSQWKSA